MKWRIEDEKVFLERQWTKWFKEWWWSVVWAGSSFAFHLLNSWQELCHFDGEAALIVDDWIFETFFEKTIELSIVFCHLKFADPGVVMLVLVFVFVMVQPLCGMASLGELVSGASLKPWVTVHMPGAARFEMEFCRCSFQFLFLVSLIAWFTSRHA